ncbi:helix-turn-helix transcriptional regulator [Micromonospora sp. WMMA1363]|uniref:helix-turn-helix domain-containing protein n=1 Tax=Micromonospora sp. WMMA1363 TaxID=3053985 RepID=UPI00259C8D2A|nr:helix-turn-helix transcriptional regulator [Micromonospora sp. WMMA1363]MDM4721191.1 helix-turn-helix transcriptional regulator [Micromonospora sp. WMMA1363]
MATGQMTAAAFLVAELRRARVRRGWSQDELARAVNYSPSMVSAVELGQQPPTGKYLEQFDKALDTGGLYTRMLTDLVSLDRAQPWLRGRGAIVAQAKVLRWFEPLYVPGLFQTEAYARAVFEAGGLLEEEDVERRLNERMEGQRILYDEEPPRLVAVVDEAALRRQVGTRKTMCDQTSHLARTATEHPRVRLHVVPQSAQEHPGLGGPFILATLREGMELAFLATQVGGQELDQPADLGRLQRVWEAILGEALPPQESLELVRKVTESWI